jgi:hypothetical protein
MVVKKYVLKWVLNGDQDKGIEGVKCEEDIEMVGLRMWVMAMD